MVQSFDELTALAGELNAKSNKLNSIIESVNKKLADLNFGLEVWMAANPLDVGDTEDTDSDGNTIDPRQDATILGYCQILDKWQLAIKDVTLVTGRDYQGYETHDVRNSTRPMSLLSAARNLRIESLRVIPVLLKSIKDEANKMLKSIDEAEESVKKLEH